MTEVLLDSLPKFATMLQMLVGFFAIIGILIFAVGLIRGRAQRPLAIIVLLGPSLLLVTVGLVFPAIRTIILSFKNSSSTDWVGFDNYGFIFTNPGQQRVLLNTLCWIIIAPIISTALGLVLSVIADQMKGKAEAIAKSLIFLPMAISFVGASVIWNLVYAYRDPQYEQTGLFSQMVMWFGVDNPPNWILMEPWNNFFLMMIMIWVETGFALVVLSASIKAIPKDVMEAATLDGASGPRQFVFVTVPMIRGTLIVVYTTILIAVLKVFDIVQTMTGGNFNTSVVANEMYNQTFVQFNVGRGSALAVVLFVAVIPLIYYNIRQLRRERSER
ncbi:MAG: sugar ABC transporter permease [Propionibacteriaceae bacterium]|jgi:alpha-glucoside transport system permease protein|nr:sugar ABC transporter permease [Propionibacteriaceae bacterium]